MYESYGVIINNKVIVRFLYYRNRDRKPKDLHVDFRKNKRNQAGNEWRLIYYFMCSNSGSKYDCRRKNYVLGGWTKWKVPNSKIKGVSQVKSVIKKLVRDVRLFVYTEKPGGTIWNLYKLYYYHCRRPAEGGFRVGAHARLSEISSLRNWKWHDIKWPELERVSSPPPINRPPQSDGKLCLPFGQRRHRRRGYSAGNFERWRTRVFVRNPATLCESCARRDRLVPVTAFTHYFSSAQSAAAVVAAAHSHTAAADALLFYTPV